MLEIDVQQEEDFAILLQDNKESKYRTYTTWLMSLNCVFIL